MVFAVSTLVLTSGRELYPTHNKGANIVVETYTFANIFVLISCQIKEDIFSTMLI